MAEGLRLTPTPSQSDALTTGVPSDRLWLRSELMGTQVITRDTGRRLGVVGEVIVDCLLYTSPSPRDRSVSRMPSSA